MILAPTAEKAGARELEMRLHGRGGGVPVAVLDGVENSPVLGNHQADVLRPARIKPCVMEMRVELAVGLGDDSIAGRLDQCSVKCFVRIVRAAVVAKGCAVGALLQGRDRRFELRHDSVGAVLCEGARSPCLDDLTIVLQLVEPRVVGHRRDGEADEGGRRHQPFGGESRESLSDG